MFKNVSTFLHIPISLPSGNLNLGPLLAISIAELPETVFQPESNKKHLPCCLCIVQFTPQQPNQHKHTKFLNMSGVASNLIGLLFLHGFTFLSKWYRRWWNFLCWSLACLLLLVTVGKIVFKDMRKSTGKQSFSGATRECIE